MSKMPLGQFFKENEKLIHFAVSREMFRLSKTGFGDHVEREELYGTLVEVFVKSYHNYDVEKSKFSTYFIAACYNRVSNLIASLNNSVRAISATELTENSFGESEGDIDEIFECKSDSEDIIDLQDSLKHVASKLSPFAQILLMYTINPPEFIEREFEARKVKSESACLLGFRGHSNQEVSISFIANRLNQTVDTPDAKRFIKRAVDEVRTAIACSLSV